MAEWVTYKTDENVSGIIYRSRSQNSGSRRHFKHIPFFKETKYISFLLYLKEREKNSKRVTHSEMEVTFLWHLTQNLPLHENMWNRHNFFVSILQTQLMTAVHTDNRAQTQCSRKRQSPVNVPFTSVRTPHRLYDPSIQIHRLSNEYSRPSHGGV